MSELVTPKHGRGKIKVRKKGDPPNPGGGRPRSIPSLEKLLEVSFAAEEPTESDLFGILQNLVRIAKNKKSPTTAVQAAERIIDRVYGKAKSNDMLTLRTQTEKDIAEGDAAAKAVIEKFQKNQ